MGKKIQISAVKLEALSEVIVLNTSFVAKAVRAADAAQKLKQHFDEYVPVSTTQIVDEKTGNCSEREVPDYREWAQRDYNLGQLGNDAIVDMFEKLVPFAIELSNALLGEE